MATKPTQKDILQKSTFKVHVPVDEGLRLAPPEFSEYIEKLLRTARIRLDSSKIPYRLSERRKEEEQKPDHAFMRALESERVSRKRSASTGDLKENQMLTDNLDVAFKSSNDPLVDLFFELEEVVSAKRLTELLETAWAKNAEETLKIIWNARSIHLGKSSRKPFYRCCGWLLDHHPLTLVTNLRWLTRPIIPKKIAGDSASGRTQDDEFEYVMMDEISQEHEDDPARFDVKNGVAHGYWKDIMNILALAANDSLHVDSDPSNILNVHPHPKLYKREWDQKKAEALRNKVKEHRFQRIQHLLQEDSKYKALHLSVARLFGEELKRDQASLSSSQHRKISLAAKWAPSSKGFHDRYTLIVSSIAEYLFRPQEEQESDRELYLRKARDAYRMHFVSPLREALQVVERDISAGTFENIKYDRVPSIAMNNYSALFIKKDTERYEKYIEEVALGKKRISGATLLPSTLVYQARSGYNTASGKSLKGLIATKIHELQIQTANNQWKTLVQRIKDSGTIENSVAVCDVSASMTRPVFRDSTCPLDSSLGLSLLLADVTKPPFGGYFITFSRRPEIQKVGGPDDQRSLREKLQGMMDADWMFDTNFVAVFEDLVLPMAVENKIAQKDMVKQVFVFSDMQFNHCGGDLWSNSFERIKRKFNEAGYELPRLIFWNLAGGRSGDTAPKPTTIDEENVVLVSGYSQAQLKMFLETGQFDGPEEVEAMEEQADQDDDTVIIKRKSKGVDSLAIVKKAISHEAYQMLKVVD